MKIYKLFVSVLLTFILFSCGGSSVSKQNLNYSELKTIKSKYSDLQFQIPRNYTLIKDNSPSYFDVCLVDNNYKNAVYLVPFIFSEDNRVEEISNLENLVNFSIALKESEFNISIDKNSVNFFETGKQKFASYTFTDKNRKNINVVIFNHISGPQEFTFKTINNNVSGKPLIFEPSVREIILSSVR